MNALAGPGTALAERPPSPPLLANRPRAVLLDVTRAVGCRLEPTLRARGYDVLDYPVLDERVFDAGVVVIEADRGARMVQGVYALRGLLDGACVVGVVGWWSEYEADLLRLADAMLHVPVRDDDLHGVLAIVQARTTPAAPVLAGAR